MLILGNDWIFIVRILRDILGMSESAGQRKLDLKKWAEGE